jgi:DNA-binding beta-propeller fold protein YncE
MEIKQRMSTRFAWLLGVVVLISIGLLVSCGTKYNSSSDGLVLVGSQGSNVVQTFSFNLGNGRISGISNPPVTNGQPFSIVMDPSGTYAYVASTVPCTPTGSTPLGGAVQAAITAYKVNSDGTLAAKGGAQYLPGNSVYPATTFPTCGLDDSTNPNPGNAVSAISMDSSGKFLFVATLSDDVTFGIAKVTLPGSVQAFSISSGTISAVSSTFTIQPTIQTPNFAALAATPTVLPPNGLNGGQNAVCSGSGNNPPTSEFLYVADSVNDVVLEFRVDTTTGALTNPPGFKSVQSFSAGSVPSGVAVDPCDRFVYVSNNQSNTISAYSICNGMATQSTNCPVTPDGSLNPIAGSPFSLSGGGANQPGPMLVDPFANALYVVGTGSGTVSIFRIGQVSGGLTSGSPATVATGSRPTSIAIRSDDSWLFVTNHDSGSLSQYSITPATGALTPQVATTTDNYPWGVAVK